MTAQEWFKKAEEHFEKKENEAALAAYTEAIKLTPDDAHVWVGKAYSLWRLDRYDEALTEVEKAIALDAQISKAWHVKGNALSDLKRPNEALEAYEKAIQLDPNFAYPWNGKGNALNNLKRQSEALKAYEKAIELDPNWAYPWHEKGNALWSLNLPNEALEAYGKAIELDPNWAYPWGGKGNSLSDLNRYNEALEAYEKAIELDPKLAASWNGKGNALWSLKRSNEALEAYEKAIELDPNDAYPWHGKGVALKDLNRPREAWEVYEKAIELDRKFAAPWNGKGIILSDQKEYFNAVKAFDQAISLDPKLRYHWNNKGIALGMLGQYTEALKCFTKAEELEPGSVWQTYLNEDTLIKYFDELRAEEEVILFEARGLVIGSGGAGKTTLIQKLFDPNYAVPNVNEPSTHGIVIHPYRFQALHEGADLLMQTHLWDFGGQEIYHSTHQYFLTHTALYILVADNRKEDTDFDYWLFTASMLGADSPIIIVLNEKEGRKKELNGTELRQSFPGLRQIISVNFATNQGLKALEEAIHYNIRQLRTIGMKIPAPWLKVREAIQALGKDFITFDEYLALCAEQGVGEEDTARAVSELWHILGFILHFQDDITLDNIVILNPEWGTSAAYAVLDSRLLKDQNGSFTLQDLRKIWSERYPRNKHQELLQLMMRFQLCYEVEKSQRYIAPQLLPEQEPKYSFPSTRLLQHQYRYTFMPKGIISRLIVALNRYIHNNLVWKNGVVLQDGDTQAEIKQNYLGHSIHIRIQGSRRKEMLYLIREQVRAIHSVFSKLEVQELIPCTCEECKNATTPEYFELLHLERAIEKKRMTIECRRSFSDVPLRGLLEAIDLFPVDIPAMKNLISKDRLSECLQALRKALEGTLLEDQIIQMQGQYAYLDQETIAGTAEEQAVQIGQSKLRKALLKLLKEIGQSSFLLEKE